MIASNTQGNDYTFEMDLCMGAWLNGCMRKGLKRLSKSIHTAAFKFISCNHTIIHSYADRAKTGNIIR